MANILPIEIVTYDDRFAADFNRLNLAWLEQFALLETPDLKYLADPCGTIVAAGGQVFFALAADKVVGTCAVIPHSPGVVEFVKFAVDKSAQRQGIGRQLAQAALEFARAQAAKKVILISNSQLVPALRLYESLGFKHAPVPADVGYVSANVYMELDL